MGILQQNIIVKWKPLNRKWYEDKGYVFTSYNDEFVVPIQDLSLGSHNKIKLQCDYCGKAFEREYKTHIQNNKNSKNSKVACSKCARKKGRETLNKLYGVDNPSLIPEVQEKRLHTFQTRYNVNNPFELESVKEKSKQTNLKKYGVEFGAQSLKVKEKIKRTNLKKYGCKAPAQSLEVQSKIINTNLQRYGVPYTQQNKKVRQKTLNTLCKKGYYRSKPEQELCELLIHIFGKEHCFPSFILDEVVLDCKLSLYSINIDIEYDGQFWHKNKEYKDLRRDKFVQSQGYKILRIKGNYEIPSKSQLIKAINYLLITIHNHYTIITDIR